MTSIREGVEPAVKDQAKEFRKGVSKIWPVNGMFIKREGWDGMGWDGMGWEWKSNGNPIFFKLIDKQLCEKTIIDPVGISVF